MLSIKSKLTKVNKTFLDYTVKVDRRLSTKYKILNEHHHLLLVGYELIPNLTIKWTIEWLQMNNISSSYRLSWTILYIQSNLFLNLTSNEHRSLHDILELNKAKLYSSLWIDITEINTLHITEKFHITNKNLEWYCFYPHDRHQKEVQKNEVYRRQLTLDERNKIRKWFYDEKIITTWRKKEFTHSIKKKLKEEKRQNNKELQVEENIQKANIEKKISLKLSQKVIKRYYSQFIWPNSEIVNLRSQYARSQGVLKWQFQTFGQKVLIQEIKSLIRENVTMLKQYTPIVDSLFRSGGQTQLYKNTILVVDSNNQILAGHLMLAYLLNKEVVEISSKKVKIPEITIDVCYLNKLPPVKVSKFRKFIVPFYSTKL